MNVMDLFSLQGRVALVTGGAGIYGVSISLALGEAKASVIIASRNLANCEGKAAELRLKRLDVQALYLDLADEESIYAMRDRIIEQYGKLDILVNNAVARASGSMETFTAEDWEQTMKVNSTGLFQITQCLAAEMVKRRSGSIINISSIYGIVGPDFSIYGSTGMTNPPYYAFAKGGMITFTRYLATYYAQYNIRVNCISPGGYGTDDHQEEFLQNYIRRTPLGRMAGEDDIKGAIVYLASDASAYVTGQNLAVDGGWTAW